MSPAEIEALVAIAREAHEAGHGGRSAVYARACRHLGISHATLMRRLKEVTVKPARKRRSDAGACGLTLPHAQRLAAHLMEGFRANDKQIQTLTLSLTQLRAHDPAFACVADPDTGELRPLSDSACARALRSYGLHPDQLRAPAPVQTLASAHPNDAWQIDASISTLFYVPGAGQSGMQDMPPGEFYKNKPGNFEKIARQRLTRYVVTDHCSGSIFVHYVAGGESTVNLAESFLAAIAQRPQQQMYGVPFHLVMDPGSASSGGAFKNLLRRLQVEPVVNQAGNARAKGQVEGAHNIVETNFESGFKFTHVPSIDWINEQAQRWMRWYNATRVHTRHGMTRWAKWLEITQPQLRLVDAGLARELLTHEPATPKVAPDMTVRFAGRVWAVSGIAGVMVGERLPITFNPFDATTALVVQHDADGREQLLPVTEATADANGFRTGAPLIGREYKSLPDTQAVTNRKLVERLATGADTDEQAAEARKAKALPFGGQLDPYRHLDDLPAAVPLPRRGTELETGTRVAAAEPVLLTHFEAAKHLVAAGVAMSPDLVATLKALHPDGVPETELDGLAARLTVRAGLRLVAGGGQGAL
ncbi:MAG: transposase [Rubrivivax sp.]